MQMGEAYPYTVQLCGHIGYEFSQDGQTQETGGCELPAEFLPDLQDLVRRIAAKYPNLY